MTTRYHCPLCKKWITKTWWNSYHKHNDSHGQPCPGSGRTLGEIMELAIKGLGDVADYIKANTLPPATDDPLENIP